MLLPYLPGGLSAIQPPNPHLALTFRWINEAGLALHSLQAKYVVSIVRATKSPRGERFPNVFAESSSQSTQYAKCHSEQSEESLVLGMRFFSRCAPSE